MGAFGNLFDDLLDSLGNHRRTIGRWALWISLVTTGIFIGLGVYITIAAITTDTTGFETNSANFTLYKNTRFAQCVFRTPQQPVNCTLVMTDLGGHKIEDGHRWLNEMSYSPGGPGAPEYDWCSLASCLRGFKVIPSEPYESAFGASGVIIWVNLLMTVFVGFWITRALFFRTKHHPDNCKGFGVFDYLSGALTLVMFGFWWHSFAVLASNPQNSPPISFLEWWPTWQFAVMLNFHPYVCRFDTKEGRGRVLVWVVASVAFLQWIATCYAFHLKHADIGTVLKYPKYRCLESEIPQAPGTSLCTSQQLCSKDWLFWNVGWHSGNALHSMQFEYPVTFYVLSTFLFVFPILSLLFSRGRKLLDFDTKGFVDKIRFSAFVGQFPILFFIMVWVSVVVLSDFFNPAREANREGPIAYDVDCQALHVPFSPWRYFLDVDEYGRALRVVKMWLNA